VLGTNPGQWQDSRVRYLFFLYVRPASSRHSQARDSPSAPQSPRLLDLLIRAELVRVAALFLLQIRDIFLNIREIVLKMFNKIREIYVRGLDLLLRAELVRVAALLPAVRRLRRQARVALAADHPVIFHTF